MPWVRPVSIRRVIQRFAVCWCIGLTGSSAAAVSVQAASRVLLSSPELPFAPEPAPAATWQLLVMMGLLGALAVFAGSALAKRRIRARPVSEGLARDPLLGVEAAVREARELAEERPKAACDRLASGLRAWLSTRFGEQVLHGHCTAEEVALRTGRDDLSELLACLDAARFAEELPTPSQLEEWATALLQAARAEA